MDGVGVDYLADERKKAQFDVHDMKIVWAGSRHAFEVSDRMARLVASDPVLTPLTLSFLFSLVPIYKFDYSVRFDDEIRSFGLL